MENISDTETHLNEALALLEGDFPLTLQNITTHLLHHIPDGLKNYGPVYGTWMYVFERFNSWLSKRTLHRRHPEATAIETYLLYDFCQFMHHAGHLKPENEKFNSMNVDIYDDVNHDDMTVKCMKQAKCITLGKRKLNAVHSALPKPSCDQNNPCQSVKQYHRHIEKHCVTQRCLTYSSSTTEEASDRGRYVSSYISMQCERGQPSQKLTTQKFIFFGRIIYFLEHISGNQRKHTVAYVKWLPGDTINFDHEARMWYSDLKDVTNLKYTHSCVLTNDISHPLITAK